MTKTLEDRVQELESKLHTVEERLNAASVHNAPQKRGWRWFVGIYEDSPDFDEVVEAGRQWRDTERMGADHTDSPETP